jgi:PadR family transcriptional regulator PadR
VRSDVYNVGMSEILGTFEQFVLLAVVALGDEAYGRAVFREVERGFGDSRTVAAGAMYTTLDRLEGKGLVTSRLEEGTPERAGRARRFYRVNAAGASALTETRRALQTMWKGKDWPLEVCA